MKSVVSEKGQVTIPKALRDRLGIGQGVVLDFEEHQGQLVARKVTAEDSVTSVYAFWSSTAAPMPPSMRCAVPSTNGDHRNRHAGSPRRLQR